MAIKNGFFNSRDRDRTYNADDITSYLEGIVGNGVFPNPSTCLQVVENAGMTVSVNSGKAWIDGYWLKSNAIFNVTIDQSDVTYDRKDRIVVKLDKEARTVAIAYKKGTAQQTATPPTMTRTVDVKEYSLATITVKKQAKSITQADIHDDRADDSICGYVKGLIEEIGTETLLKQYETMWKQYFDKSTDDFRTWFDGLKENLSTATLVRQFSGVYTTTQQDQTIIPIPIEGYLSGIDVMNVYVNGLMFVKDVHYTESGPNQITLNLPLDKGQDVYFVVFKSVDGENAVKVVDQVAELNRLKNVVVKGYNARSSGWAQDGSYKSYTITDSNISESDIVKVNFDIDSYEKARTAQVLGTTKCLNGSVKLYAKTAPDSDLTLDYIVFKGTKKI